MGVRSVDAVAQRPGRDRSAVLAPHRAPVVALGRGPVLRAVGRVPVVASPVGMNKNVVVAGKTGFLPNNLDEWCEVFQILTQDKTKSCNFGTSGRQVVENEYTLQMYVRKLATVLKTV